MRQKHLGKDVKAVRVGIIGSRDCKNLTVEAIAAYLPESCTEIVSGGALGVDALAERLAAEKQLPLRKFLPDYQAYGKRAPLIRNLKIVENCDHLLAFWDCYSRGTAHTINACIEQRVPMRIIPI